MDRLPSTPIITWYIWGWVSQIAAYGIKGFPIALKVSQSCLILHDPMDHSPWSSPGQNTGVGGFFPSPEDLPDPRNQTGILCWRRDRLPTPVCLGFTGDLIGKEFACNTGDLGSILGLGLEKEKATHSSIPAWESYGLYSPWGHKESYITEWLSPLLWP